METVLGLTFATLPVVITVALLLAADRREARRSTEVSRQVALTDALHAQLGAVVAPVVRRRRRGWQISVAVPVEQPAIVAAVLRTVDEVFGRAAYEVQLRRALSWT